MTRFKVSFYFENNLPHLDLSHQTSLLTPPVSRPPASNTSLVVFPNSVLNAIGQVNKHHRGPSTPDRDRELGMPQTGPVGGHGGGADEGVVYIFLW